MTIAIIGGGAAGVLAGIGAGTKEKVIIFEKNEKLMKKVYITGKGRCNLTNDCPVEDIISSLVNNPYFMYSSLYQFSNEDMMKMVEEDVPLKVERGGRVFPVSDKSSDIMKALERRLHKNNVKILYNTKVNAIEKKEKFMVYTNKKNYVADKVIIATGGITYPATGSTGDGYEFASKMGHKIIRPRPGLIALNVKEDVSDLEGISLRNIGISYRKEELFYDEIGEVLYTKRGLSGPLILTLSSLISKSPGGIIHLDLKPGLTKEQLDRRLLRDFEKYANRDIKNGLKDLLLNKMIHEVLTKSKIPEDRKINQLTRKERIDLVETIKDLRYHILGTEDAHRGIITAGGVHVDEVDPSTMESKYVENLYFAGEILDIDGLTGGFNLQIAWSTGFVAGKSAGGKDNE
ncbi:MAG: NAD(P)/FAD-dependent oxidoreductase [Tissierellia bacterium]|nr:NAD(P)/FAD-dependent oxidoreductase [Tissierellia bacterium]